MDKKQVEKETFCPAKKEDYLKCIFRQGELDCWYCPIPMKDCKYWQSRLNDRPVKLKGKWL